MRGTWSRRIVLLAVVAGLAFLVLHAVGRDPEPIRFTALCVVLVTGAWVVQDLMTSTTPPPGFAPAEEHHVDPRGVDPRTDALARLVEGHLKARRPDRQLHGRLVELADRRLAQRHDVRLADQPDRARDLLGDEAFRHLTRPPRRYSPAAIASTLSRIEDL